MKRLILIAFLILASSPAFAVVHTMQVTIGATAVAVAAGDIRCKWVVFQNNTASDTMRIGDSSVSSSVGIKLVAGGSFFSPPAAPQGYSTDLKGWYISGTQNDVIDIVYDDGQ